MDTRPEQPPEGKLIADAADRLSLSIREAARRAGLSYGRWRQIAQGYQNVSPGSYAKVRAPAKTLAKMAAVVGVSPEQMETEGQRPDAAEVMRQQAAVIPPHHAAAGPHPGPRRSGLLDAMDSGTRDQVMPDYREILDAAIAAIIDHPGVPLAGVLVFPGDPDEATRWDVVAARGQAIYPGEGFSLEELATALALVRLADRRENQGGAAAGLTRTALARSRASREGRRA